MRTDYLFAMPSVWSGAARVFDLFGVFDTYNDSASHDVADARAIYSDWRITGQDPSFSFSFPCSSAAH